MLKTTGRAINDTITGVVFTVPHTLGTLAPYTCYLDTANLAKQTKTAVVLEVLCLDLEEILLCLERDYSQRIVPKTR